MSDIFITFHCHRWGSLLWSRRPAATWCTENWQSSHCAASLLSHQPWKRLRLWHRPSSSVKLLNMNETWMRVNHSYYYVNKTEGQNASPRSCWCHDSHHSICNCSNRMEAAINSLKSLGASYTWWKMSLINWAIWGSRLYSCACDKSCWHTDPLPVLINVLGVPAFITNLGQWET